MNNDEKHIESLLYLFMQGETTLEQEQELKHYFSGSHAIPEEWESYREMMAYFDAGMPIETESNFKPKVARHVWTLAAAAAVAAIIIMVVPHLSRSPKATQAITSDDNTAKTHRAIDSTSSSPIIAKAEKMDITLNPPEPAAHKIKQKHKNAASHIAPLNAIEMEREQGEMEQAQQELMADKYIIEQERQEILDEQYSGRAQAYQAQQAFNNENPQFIPVVFK